VGSVEMTAPIGLKIGREVERKGTSVAFTFQRIPCRGRGATTKVCLGSQLGKIENQSLL